MTRSGAADAPWWRDAVIYQIYVRSFADADGDGIGDLPGIRSRLATSRDLGVDAIWLNPFYPSPQADAGYDVADYRDVDPRFGTLADADALLADAHALGLRVIVDLVPNHTSTEHAWFRAALAAGAGQPRARPLPVPRRPRAAAATTAERLAQRLRRTGVDPGHRGRRLARPVVPAPVRPRAARPRLDQRRGARRSSSRSCASGSTAASTGSASTSPTGWPRTRSCPTSAGRLRRRRPAPHGPPALGPGRGARGLPGVAAAHRRLRRATATFVAEAWVQSPDRLARYLRPDELHTAFNFDFLLAPWDADGAARRPSTTASTALAEVGAPADLGAVQPRRRPPRHPLRRRRAGHAPGPGGGAADARPARAAPTSTRARSSACPRSPTCPTSSARTRPSCAPVARSLAATAAGCRCRGRGESPRSGSGPAGKPWLPQPADWAALTVERQASDPASMLSLYRDALSLRRTLPALGDGELAWLEAGAGPARLPPRAGLRLRGEPRRRAGPGGRWIAP